MSLPTAAMIECGMVLLLMLLFSPNSSRAHFCVMFLPAFCVARGAMYWRSRGLRVMIALAAISSLLSYHLRLPSTFAAEQFLLWLGVVMFSAIFLLVGSGMELPRAVTE